MLNTVRGFGGIATAPHHLASQAGADVLREGGNALEAMIAMAATIAVVYSHMNAIGGDGFWLAAVPGEAPVGIQACGPAATRATPAFYRAAGHQAIPQRGGLSALTVAGTVAGWDVAHGLARAWGGRMAPSRLMEHAVHHASDGIAISESQARLTREKLGELSGIPGFAQTYLADGKPPPTGARLRQEKLGATLEHLGRAGYDDFYRGDLARSMANDLETAGSPVALADLEAYRAATVAPLSVGITGARIFNMPPPTQGVASLLILAVLDRLGRHVAEDAAFVHEVVEATKQAFLVRDAEVLDPAFMGIEAASLLADERIDAMAARIDRKRALDWPCSGPTGDTIWMGAIDAEGRAVSFIQSIYWEFGSGIVLPGSGVLWQNRGVSFSLEDGHRNRLEPGRLPFHTLNPALACFDDGRTMVYGTMGGEGQPQTQAAIFARYAWGGQGLQAAVTAPRWLLGRTWGEETTSLKIESRFSSQVLDALKGAGHDVEPVDAYSDMMGHAGAAVVHADGLMEGAADPRSNGAVATA